MKDSKLSKIISVVFVLVLGSCASLWPKEIRGVIQNVNFKTIDVARIHLKETGQYFYSGKSGRFKIHVPDQYPAVTLVFHNTFYYTKTLRVTMDREVKEINILLVPREHLKEEVTVTALSYEEKAVTVPMAESVVSELEIKEKIAENLVDTLQNTPGVHIIGQGGFSATPSIRGIARRRVLLLIDGTRVTSDRRAGTSASFIAPELIKRIEVVRSASSVLYGSDAIGGVVQSFTRSDQGEEFPKNSLNLSFNSANERLNSGLTFTQRVGKANIYTAFQYAKAGNYSSPEQEIFNSGFTNYSGILDLSLKGEKRDIELYYLGGLGKDIGKPDRANNPDSYSIVPRDINQLINFQYKEKNLVKNGSLGLQFYINPTRYDLENINVSKNSIESSETTAVNYGLKLNLTKSLSDKFSYQVGIEQYSRSNVDMENAVTQENEISRTSPLKHGRRSDTGIYLTADYAGIPGFDFIAGLRYTFFSLKADVLGNPLKIQADSPSVFFGTTKKVGNWMTLFFNLGRAYRTPSLSEAFYTGITGRRYVIANPSLKPEKSFNIDTGVKIFSKKIFLGFYLFSCRIDDMIERYKNEENVYTHDNIMVGTIRGGEIEFQLFPLKNLEIFGHYFYYTGRSKVDNNPLNDVPAPQFLLGGKLFIDKFWCEVNCIHSFKKEDPGPAEVLNDAYTVLDLKAGYYLSANLFFYFKAANLLNETYYANPDPDIPQARKLDLSAGMNFYF